MELLMDVQKFCSYVSGNYDIRKRETIICDFLMNRVTQILIP
jgi:hypothetical protein